MKNVPESNLKFAIIWDSGAHISSIKRELQVQGVKEIHIDHITCTTDRGDQDLGYEINFGSSDMNLIEEMLKCYHGYTCADNST